MSDTNFNEHVRNSLIESNDIKTDIKSDIKSDIEPDTTLQSNECKCKYCNKVFIRSTKSKVCKQCKKDKMQASRKRRNALYYAKKTGCQASQKIKHLLLDQKLEVLVEAKKKIDELFKSIDEMYPFAVVEKTTK